MEIKNAHNGYKTERKIKVVAPAGLEPARPEDTRF
jgi:hypothetical protein